MNLVFEPMDRIMVLEKVSSILSNHPPMRGRNCDCELCQQAAEIGRAARYSPKVARILAKGEDMTTEEVKYLYKKGLTATEISQQTGIAVSDLPKEKDTQTTQPIKFGIEGLTKEQYKEHKAAGMTEQKIARLHKISTTRLKEWRDRTFTPGELRKLRLNPWSNRRGFS